MNIAFDTGPLSSGHAVRGVGFYTEELLKELRKQRIGLEKLVIDEFDFSTNRKSLASGRYDIIHCSYFHPFFLTVPRSFKGKLVVTIHDLIQLIYPKQYPPGLKGKIKFQLQRYLIKKADAIISVSETSKKDIVRFLGLPNEKIHVIYEAGGGVYKKLKREDILLKKVRSEYKLPKKFVLYLGDVNYNKNIPTLISACRLGKVPLVIVGKHATEIEERGLGLQTLEGPRDWIRFLFNKPHPELAHYEELLEEFKKSKNIIRTGYVSDEELNAILNLATVYCQPSFYEGFGLPVLQAMACGVPVIASKTQTLFELYEGSVLFANPKDPKEFAMSIKNLFGSSRLRNEYSKKGRKKASEFSWKKTAKETLSVYEKLVK